MTYLGASAGYWVGQANDFSTGSHPTGWTNGQRWSETAAEWNTMYNSSQSALAAMTTDRNTWQANANTAYDSAPPTWGVGTHWHTRYDQEHALYTALLAGLNNPEGLVYVSISQAWPGQNATSAPTTLTLPRTGHWFLGAVVDGTVNLQSFGSVINVNVAGIFGATKTTNCGANSGTQQYHAGFQIDGDYTAGQVLTVNVSNSWIGSGSISGTLFAHFIPNATYHN